MKKKTESSGNKSSDSDPEISIVRLKSLVNPDEIRKYLIGNRSQLFRQIDLRGDTGRGRETVSQINTLFNVVFKYLEYEEIFRFLEDISLGVYIDNELDEGFQIGFYVEICNLILDYHQKDIAKGYLDENIFWLFPYFLEIKDRDEEVRSVLLKIKRAWLPLCRDLDKDDSKALKRIFGPSISKEWA